MIEVAFEGSPMQSEVQTMLEAVMKTYKIEVNDENIKRVSSVLVNLRKKSNLRPPVTEMEILKDIYQNGNTAIEFTEQAAISLMKLESTK